MTRWRLILEYDGTGFVGWQRQANGTAVQQVVEDAVERLTGERVRVQGAGRTDAGVHAEGQVAHLDLEREMPLKPMRDGINHFMRPHPVAVLEARPIAPDFDARFSATGRAYLYRILNRQAPPVLERGRVWHVRNPLDAEAMHDAAQLLVGRHDFTSFRAAQCQANSPIRTLDRIAVSRVGDEVHLTVGARSFLHNQVRILTGTLRQVGDGRWTKRNVADALAAARRGAAGPTAPPDGLYLTRVTYPDEV